MTKTYGIISDLHETDIKLILPTIELLIQEGAESFILNGDLIGDRTDFTPSQYFGLLLEIAGKSNLPTYVLPGSHEEVPFFESALKHFTEKYPNVINASHVPKFEQEDHDLIFLPGSVSHPSTIENPYILNTEMESGVYKAKNNSIARFTNPNNLKTLVTRPEKTIVVCHNPAKFNNLEYAVDVAEFGVSSEAFVLDGREISPGAIFPLGYARFLKEKGAPIELKKENRGNKDLINLFRQLGIKKAISAHFHESAGRANDLSGNHVEEGNFVNELFYNGSCIDRYTAGLLTVSDSKVAYENIGLTNKV